MRARAAVGVALLAMVLAGCGGSGTPPASPAAPPATPSQNSAPPASVKPTPLNIGDTAALFADFSGAQEGSAKILAIEVDPPCSQQWKDQTRYDPSHLHPHQVAVQMIVDVNATSGSNLINTSRFNIREVLPDGTVATSDAHGAYGSICLKDRPTVDTVDAGTSQRGWILLGAENPTGTFLWKNSKVGPGYTLAYPQEASPPSSSVVPTTAGPTTAQYVPPTTTERPAPTTTAYTQPSCPPGTVFSPLADACVSPQQKAQTENNEAQCGGGNGPVSVCGPRPSSTYVPVP